jgi:uncharacterized RDD family membrane protein YckC
MSDNFVPPAPPAPPPAFAPPPAPAPLAPPAPRYAGFWIRFVAVFIDAIILALLRGGAGVVIRLAAGAPAWPAWRGTNWMDSGFNGLGCAQEAVGLVLWWLYHASFESSTAQGTLGKQALGLKVTDLYGRRISFGRASGRTLAKILSTVTLLIGFVMAAFTLRKQALHDFVAETVVLRGWRGR